MKFTFRWLIDVLKLKPPVDVLYRLTNDEHVIVLFDFVPVIKAPFFHVAKIISHQTNKNIPDTIIFLVESIDGTTMGLVPMVASSLLVPVETVNLINVHLYCNTGRVIDPKLSNQTNPEHPMDRQSAIKSLGFTNVLDL